MWAAMKSAAPQMPAGRRPVCIQSRFIEATSRSAVLATYNQTLSLIEFQQDLRDGSTGMQIYREFR